MNNQTAARIALVRVIVFALLGCFALFADAFAVLPPWQRYGLAGLMFAYAAFRAVSYWNYIRQDKSE
ncbi:MAG: hypothetical protein ACFCUI_02900 [Bernardetiaceae bacterium]